MTRAAPQPRPAARQASGHESVGQRPVAGLREHPHAELVPPMTGAEYSHLLSEVERGGLLTPLEITAAGVVLNGRHRLRVARELGLTVVPIRVVGPADELEYMFVCALAQRHLSPSQRAAIAIELKQVREAGEQGRARQRANLRRGNKAPEVATLPARGRTRDQAARLAGASPRLVQDAITVQRADPELLRRVKLGELTLTLAAGRVRRAARDATLPAPPPLPSGPFELIYADPPWQLGNPDGEWAPEQHYPTMPLEEIAARKPPAAENALLYLWAVNMRLPEALQVLEAWGFNYLTNQVWVKPSIGLGHWTRNRHELLLIGRSGRPATPDRDRRPDSVIESARGRHSQKPEQVYQLLEQAYPHMSKLEMFARQARPGWTAWGKEAPA